MAKDDASAPRSGRDGKQAAREARLAAQLRANLQRRRAQQRARAEEETPAPSARADKADDR